MNIPSPSAFTGTGVGSGGGGVCKGSDTPTIYVRDIDISARISGYFFDPGTRTGNETGLCIMYPMYIIPVPPPLFREEMCTTNIMQYHITFIILLQSRIKQKQLVMLTYVTQYNLQGDKTYLLDYCAL